MKIVFLDRSSIGEDLDLSEFDVFAEEPMRKDSPLLRIKDSDRLLVTPHIAWASVEARRRLMRMIADQIRDFCKS